MLTSVTHAYLCGIYVESSVGKEDILSSRAEEVFADFLAYECGLNVTRYQKGAGGSESIGAGNLVDLRRFENSAYTRSEVLSSLLIWLDQLKERSVKECLIYFCGHGAIDSSGFALLTRDTEPSFCSETGISLSFLYHILRRFDGEDIRFLLIVDACMNGSSRRFMTERFPKNVSVLFSTKRGEVAVQGYGSIFINNFIQSTRSVARPSEDDETNISVLSDIVWSLEHRCSEFGFDQFLSHPDEVAIPCSSYSVSKKLAKIKISFSEKLRDFKEAERYEDLLNNIVVDLKFKYSEYILLIQSKIRRNSKSGASLSLEFSSSAPLSFLYLLSELREKLPVFSAVTFEVRRPRTEMILELRQSVEEAFGASFFTDFDTEISSLSTELNGTKTEIIQMDNVFDFKALRNYREVPQSASILTSGRFQAFMTHYLATMEPAKR